MLPRVVCICPSRDRPHFLERARRCFEAQTYENKRLYVLDTRHPPFSLLTIGMIRNIANQAAMDAQIIAHWDDDDYSYPGRLSEQVALLNGVQAVGYREMLFYDSRISEAWLYRGAADCCIGTSLAYWRTVWKQKPFANTNEGEDNTFGEGLLRKTLDGFVDGRPRMIAEIHGANTWGKIQRGMQEFSRVREWDGVCGETLGYDRT